MPVAPPALPAALVLPTRDQVRDWWLRDYGLRNPGARIDPGTEPYIKASVYADAATPLYCNSQTIAANTSRQTMVGSALDDEAESLGTQRLPPVGASGAVAVTTSAGGVTIYQGDLFVIGSNTVYQCTQTAVYSDANPVPVLGVTTGPGTDQNAGTIGNWQIPRPGCAATATVTAAVDGTGLSGGHDQETDDQLRSRLNYMAANPPASGNDADIQGLASRCPGLSVEAVFTYPCCNGPGTTSVTFTLRASATGGNRIPNPAQVALMSAWLQGPGALPADLSILVFGPVAQPTPIVLEPDWASTSPGWTDSTPWPAFTAIGTEPQIAAPTTGTASATYFRIINAAVAPSVGQTIAVFDQPNLTFREKKILSYTVDGGAGGGYDITVDTSDGVSDTSYTPVVGQFCCPWSDSLQTLVAPIVAYLATLGPGEQYASFLDPGARQKRNPPSPATWPSVVSQRIYAGPTNTPFTAYGQQPAPQAPSLATLGSLLDVGITEPVLPLVTNSGSPGINASLIVLSDLTGYP